MGWLKRQVADHPFRVLVTVLGVLALVSWIGLPDPHARDGHDRTPLIVAAYEGDQFQARVWHALGADLDAEEPCGTTPLMRALQREHLQLADWLLDQGADAAATDETGLSALHLAARTGAEELAGRLVKEGADPSAEETVYGRSPIDEAEEAGHDDLARLLRDSSNF